MILPYTLRLFVLSLGCFFLIQLVCSCAINLFAARLLKLAERRRAGSAASLLLGARLLPAAAALLIVGGICVPSYFSLEPRTNSEEVGLVVLAMAFFGGLGCVLAAKRGISAVVFSRRSARYFERSSGIMAVAGILRPRILISPDVIRGLSEPELAAAVRHEQAHASSRDNLKRLLVLLAPCGLPLRMLGGFAALETAWAKYTEWSADDRAVAGDPGRALSLAGALVTVARMRVPLQTAPLITPLVADAADLEVRIHRLLAGFPAPEKSDRICNPIWAVAVCTSGFLFAIAAPQMFEVAHRLLEYLI